MQTHELIPALADNEVRIAPIMMVKAKYDFAVDGGAIGDIDLLPDALIPSGATVLAAFIKPTVALTSGGAATIALKVEGAADLQAAAAYNAAPYSTLTRKAATKTIATNPVDTTADRNIVATIAGAALTAGAFEVIVLYLPAGF